MTKKTTPKWETALARIEQKGWGDVNLLCDGIAVSWRYVRVGNRLCFIYYIDGEFHGYYSNSDSPIGAKFGIPQRARMSKEHYDTLVRHAMKAYADERKAKIAATVLGYNPFHNTAASVIRTLKRTCTEITLGHNAQL